MELMKFYTRQNSLTGFKTATVLKNRVIYKLPAGHRNRILSVRQNVSVELEIILCESTLVTKIY